MVGLTETEERFVALLLAPGHERGDWRRISEVMRRHGAPRDTHDRIFDVARARLVAKRRARDAGGGVPAPCLLHITGVEPS
jgi:hypothetical protein